MKKCNQCKKVYPSSPEYFYRNKNKKQGLYDICKECYKSNFVKYKDRARAYKIKWSKDNEIKLRKNKKKYYLKNKTAIINKSKEYVKNNLNKVKKYRIDYYCENKEYIKNKCKCYYSKNKRKVKLYQRNYKMSNKIKIAARNKDYRTRHKDQYNAYVNNRRKTDIGFKIKMSLRNEIHRVLKFQNCKKIKHTMDLIGCTIDKFKRHIESKFLYGMTWDNYGRRSDQWSIDHIVPCAAFDLTKEKNQKRCFRYTNLRPLWNPEQWHKNSFYNGKRIAKFHLY